MVFVVDVSRSMLAQDLAPNRLERAKLAIVDTLEVLRAIAWRWWPLPARRW